MNACDLIAEAKAREAKTWLARYKGMWDAVKPTNAVPESVRRRKRAAKTAAKQAISRLRTRLSCWLFGHSRDFILCAFCGEGRGR